MKAPGLKKEPKSSVCTIQLDLFPYDLVFSHKKWRMDIQDQIYTPLSLWGQ